jgi:hypothetical protein
VQASGDFLEIIDACDRDIESHAVDVELGRLIDCCPIADAARGAGEDLSCGIVLEHTDLTGIKMLHILFGGCGQD